MPDLTTVAAVKAQMETTSTATDALIATHITDASAAILDWSGREYAGPAAAETRDIEVKTSWRRTGEVRVGDMRAVPSAVAVLDADMVQQGTLDPTLHLTYLPAYRRPDRPIERVRLRSSAPVGLAVGYFLRITALWGWPAVPDNVERACIITVRAWLRTDAASSAEYGYDEGGRVVQSTPEGGWMLPTAAKQLLRATPSLPGIA